MSNATINREFAEADWPFPPYLQLGGFLSPLAKAVKDAPKNAKLEIMRERLGSAYSISGEVATSCFGPPTNTALAGFSNAPEELQHFMDVCNHYDYWVAPPEENAAVGISLF